MQTFECSYWSAFLVDALTRSTIFKMSKKVSYPGQLVKKKVLGVVLSIILGVLIVPKYRILLHHLSVYHVLGEISAPGHFNKTAHWTTISKVYNYNDHCVTTCM